MIDPLANTRIWVAAGFTDMRCGFDGLAAKVQTVLAKDPFSGHIFVFRGKRGDLIKCLYWRDGGLCLFAKRLERGRFAWPRADGGVVSLTSAQLGLLLEGGRASGLVRIQSYKGWRISAGPSEGLQGNVAGRCVRWVQRDLRKW